MRERETLNGRAWYAVTKLINDESIEARDILQAVAQCLEAGASSMRDLGDTLSAKDSERQAAAIRRTLDTKAFKGEAA